MYFPLPTAMLLGWVLEPPQVPKLPPPPFGPPCVRSTRPDPLNISAAGSPELTWMDCTGPPCTAIPAPPFVCKAPDSVGWRTRMGGAESGAVKPQLALAWTVTVPFLVSKEEKYAGTSSVASTVMHG